MTEQALQQCTKSNSATQSPTHEPAIVLDPKNGVYITDTRFAVVTHEKHKGKPALLQVSTYNRSYSLVSWHDSDVSLVAELVNLHVSHIRHRMRSVDDYLNTVEVITRRCQAALNLLNPDTYGGIVV
ncbi:DUF5405 family protein [Xenorhabdus bovienii]|uniref:DUF5405 family protein n=1 Tax=Xenorhabdus bovienii TaxID=40576 RepID=UPI0023B27475|nr:DUF5405 family protein [Xenorhabdus bovienii]MDE9494717.1 DUF5405 family protein [Xenorhabdus bovienii]MDE9503076.1 DUF5405 family protein [Xenorhabdus bovienii]